MLGPYTGIFGTYVLVGAWTSDLTYGMLLGAAAVMVNFIVVQIASFSDGCTNNYMGCFSSGPMIATVFFLSVLLCGYLAVIVLLFTWKDDVRLPILLSFLRSSPSDSDQHDLTDSR